MTSSTCKFSTAQSGQRLQSWVGFPGLVSLVCLVRFFSFFLFVKRKFCMFLDNIKFCFSFGKQ